MNHGIRNKSGLLYCTSPFHHNNLKSIVFFIIRFDFKIVKKRGRALFERVNNVITISVIVNVQIMHAYLAIVAILNCVLYPVSGVWSRDVLLRRSTREGSGDVCGVLIHSRPSLQGHTVFL